MRNGARIGILAAVLIVAAGAWWWTRSGTPDERAIRGRLTALADEINGGTTDGLGTVARAARLGDFFAPDVVVELGQGSPPIQGRETLMGMAARLQPRTAAFEVTLKDINVEVVQDAAEATFTALISRRSLSSGEQSLDAREFSAALRKTQGTWRIYRVVAVDTLR